MSKFYITTSIPYANSASHIGHILDPLIADVLSRYHRIKGDEVRFLVGTDEHGAKIVRKAEEVGKTPQKLVDENSANFREMHELLNIKWDDFIRTSDQKRHWPGAQKMWNELKEVEDIYWKKYRGLYCVGHEAFITEKDLVNGKCQDHQKEPEAVNEENWFFRLSKYSKQIEDAIVSNKMKVRPGSRKNEILSFIRGGLEDISISRPRKDIPWGVPTPDDPTQMMYVWLEALTSYLSSIGYGQEDEQSKEFLSKWWPADAQIVGKDNLRFHAAIFPGMLLSAGLELPKEIFIHGFVNVDGQKISKTVGNVIVPKTIVDKYGVDPVRYFFLREFPAQEDGDFSYKKLEERYNGDLANGLGNLVQRVATLIENNMDRELIYQTTNPSIGAKHGTGRGNQQPTTNNSNYEKAINEFRLHDALGEVWEMISGANKYIDERKPWLEAKESPERFLETMTILARTIHDIAWLLQPFMPETAQKIAEIFGDDLINKEIPESYHFYVKKSKPLFPRL
ncbi:MAG: methionine--tRNA ligase [Candidatus Yanofskybacteria bacterium RIFCSPHIGHO2_02_FULL_41_11]|uniref:Methionine--tRNA ligase n=1 Tax=Candidatus Yanofskybacteria bacterium RIFCSPHIGHO2_02_FULL_41_11 TaxID=1802675 RepID=A0A1F8F7G9_9BACT|nr:MAG: methionine--tRNA ligase [Candidatus Yanofskybacteria bacterium RIFCSPHIGHO2_02_FULL_41_11]